MAACLITLFAAVILLTTSPVHDGGLSIADGTYSYGTSRVVQWTVTIANHGTSIAETTTVNTRLPSKSNAELDPRTLQVRNYASHIGGPMMWISDEARSTPDGIIYHVTRCVGALNDCTEHTDVFSPVRGTKRIVFFEPLLMPALVEATGEHTFTTITSNYRAKTTAALVKVLPMILGPPQGVPANDRGITIMYPDRAEDVWFDPKTLVVDAYGSDAQHLITRIRVGAEPKEFDF